MKYILHRQNQISDLQVPWDADVVGCEIDLRSDVHQRGAIHLSHDAWTQGDLFQDWLQIYASRKPSGPLILNTKEDGLETTAMELLKKVEVTKYFFLDTTLPTLIKNSLHLGIQKFAVRFSAYEPMELALQFQGKVDWVWVDCFSQKPANVNAIKSLKDAGFQICLVSPELQGPPLGTLRNFEGLYSLADAICTKTPSLWRKTFEAKKI